MAYLRERKWILLFAVVVTTITTVPYLIGYALETDEWAFTGFVIAVEDGNSYIAKMLAGSAGKWLFKSPFSAVEQRGVIAFLPYILLGKLASGESIHEQLVVIYHSFRIFGGILFFLAGYDFISLFVQEERWRRWALAFFCLGGGMGWVLVLLEKKDLFGVLPLDFISPESFGFLSIFGFPHLAAGRALFLWSLTHYLKRSSGYVIGLILLLLGIVQPIYVVIAWVVMITHLAVVLFLSRSYIGKMMDLDKIQISKDGINLVKDILIYFTFIL